MAFFTALTQIDFLWPYAAAMALLPFIFRKSASQDNEYPELGAPAISAYTQAHAKYGFATESSQREHKRKKVFLYILWLMLTLGLMRPQFFGASVEVPLEGRDLMLAIDISPSMKEVDMPLNGQRAMRIDVVKSVVGDFSQRREGDRIGLILFGTQPYVQSPLSFDTETVNTLLQESFLGMAGQATAIGDAIALAVKRLKERPEQSRVLILLTDGANTAGEIPPQKAAQLASSFGVKIYTVGIGADEMLQRSFFGTRTVNPSADLDEGMLRTIADTTDGKYFRARNTEELEKIYSEIDQLEPIESAKRTYRPQKSLVHLPVLAALFLFVLYKLIVVAQRVKMRRRTKANRDELV